MDILQEKQDYSSEYLTSIPEYGQLYKIKEKPDNKRLIWNMYMIPLNKTDWYVPKNNRFWAGKCCYILKELDTEFVNVIICHEMFFFKKDYRIFTIKKEDIEECGLSYLLSKQKEQLHIRECFFK